MPFLVTLRIFELATDEVVIRKTRRSFDYLYEFHGPFAGPRRTVGNVSAERVAQGQKALPKVGFDEAVRDLSVAFFIRSETVDCFAMGDYIFPSLEIVRAPLFCHGSSRHSLW